MLGVVHEQGVACVFEDLHPHFRENALQNFALGFQLRFTDIENWFVHLRQDGREIAFAHYVEHLNHSRVGRVSNDSWSMCRMYSSVCLLAYMPRTKPSVNLGRSA